MSRMTRSQTMAVPNPGSTRNASSAMPASSVCTAASSTWRPCSESTPATRANMPGRSGNTTVRRSSTPSMMRRRWASRARCWGLGNAAEATSDSSPPPSTWAVRADELPDQLVLPRAPGRGSGGEGVGLGQRIEEAQRGEVARGFGDVGDGVVVGEVAAGGHVGQQQVVADHLLEHLGVAFGEAHAGAHDRHLLDADVDVVARVALADVVQEGADDEQVGAVDPVDHRRRRWPRPRRGADRR